MALPERTLGVGVRTGEGRGEAGRPLITVFAGHRKNWTARQKTGSEPPPSSPLPHQQCPCAELHSVALEAWG